MKNFNRLLQGLLLLISSYSLRAQQTFNPGDTLPINLWRQIVEHPSVRSYATPSKKQLYILDFWAFTCKSCIESFPKLDSLQQKYDDNVVIILVNQESKEATDHFFTNHPRLIRPRVAMISEDTILNRYFPHYAVPFCSWLDSTGVYRFAGFGRTMNNTSLREYIAAQSIPKSGYISRRFVRSLFADSLKESIQGYSYVVRCIDHGALQVKSLGPGTLFSTGRCVSILELYQTAYNESTSLYYGFNRPGRLELHVKDPNLYTRPSDHDQYSDWFDQNTYYYQLYLPKAKHGQLYTLMKQDLDRYFNLIVRIQPMKRDCLVLKKTTSSVQLHSTQKIKKDNFYRSSPTSVVRGSIRYFYGKSFDLFSTRLAYILETEYKQPFLDDTGYHGSIDIVIDGNTLDELNIDGLNDELRPFGLVIRRETRTVNILVLREPQ